MAITYREISSQNSVLKKKVFQLWSPGPALGQHCGASVVHIKLHKLVVSVSYSNSFLPGLLTGSKGGQVLIEAAICTPLLLHWFCCIHLLPFVSILSLSLSLSLSPSPSHPLSILTCFGVVSVGSWILQTEVHQIPGKKCACVCMCVYITFAQSDTMILRLCAHNVQWHRLRGM